MAVCLSGRFLNCQAAVGSTGGIWKSACSHFLDGTVRGIFQVGSRRYLWFSRGFSRMLTESCLGGTARSECSV